MKHLRKVGALLIVTLLIGCRSLDNNKTMMDSEDGVKSNFEYNIFQINTDKKISIQKTGRPSLTKPDKQDP